MYIFFTVVPARRERALAARRVRRSARARNTITTNVTILINYNIVIVHMHCNNNNNIICHEVIVVNLWKCEVLYYTLG